MRRLSTWYSALVVAAAVVMSAAAYPRLPERVPIHWGINGEPDRWGSRFEGAMLFPFVMFGAWLLLRFLPRIDPRAPNYAKMQSTYDFMINAVLTLLLLVHAMVLAAGLGYAVPVGRITPVLIGALFVTLGNVLPRARPNWWFGIRTPWTLSSDRVWARTHRVGGYAMTAAGIVILAGAALPGIWPFAVFIVSAAVAAIFPIVYSYLAWRQETRS
jgi:immunity protein, SdpI family